MSCILLIVILLIGYLVWRYTNLSERFDNQGLTIKYYRINDKLVESADSLPIMDVFKEAFEQSGAHVKKSTFTEAKILQFETLNNIDHAMLNMRMPSTLGFIYGLAGSDLLAGKQALFYKMKECLGWDVLKHFPKSYLPSIPEDMEQLASDFRASANVYIMKKNIQRQQGHLIINDLDDIMKRKDEYVIIQEVLQNPLLVNQRKINMRVYLLVVQKQEETPQFYVYNDGFMYYTPKPFKANSIDPDEIITTGYIDRAVYAVNPLTIQDLYRHLGTEKSAKLKHNMMVMFGKIKRCYEHDIYRFNKNKTGVKFLIYGCDVAPSSDLECYLMEINKGPDLSYKDERDKDVKLNMVSDMLSLVGLLKQETLNKFIKI
jgi:hypothetical protein